MDIPGYRGRFSNPPQPSMLLQKHTQIILKNPILGSKIGKLEYSNEYAVGYYIKIGGVLAMIAPWEIDWEAMNKNTLKQALGIK